MKRNQIIIIAIAAFVGLWMYSQSGKASTTIFDGVSPKQTTSESTFPVDR